MTKDAVDMVRRVYRLRVTGEMGPAMREAFSDLHAQAEQGHTVLSGELADQAALYSVLERLQALGLDLVDVAVVTDEG
jgi:hypothetical protein